MLNVRPTCEPVCYVGETLARGRWTTCGDNAYQSTPIGQAVTLFKFDGEEISEVFQRTPDYPDVAVFFGLFDRVPCAAFFDAYEIYLIDLQQGRITDTIPLHNPSTMIPKKQLVISSTAITFTDPNGGLRIWSRAGEMPVGLGHQKATPLRLYEIARRQLLALDGTRSQLTFIDLERMSFRNEELDDTTGASMDWEVMTTNHALIFTHPRQPCHVWIRGREGNAYQQHHFSGNGLCGMPPVPLTTEESPLYAHISKGGEIVVWDLEREKEVQLQKPRGHMRLRQLFRIGNKLFVTRGTSIDRVTLTPGGQTSPRRRSFSEAGEPPKFELAAVKLLDQVDSVA